MKPLARAAGAEQMDAPDVDPAQLERSLNDLRSVNRWLGGTRVLLRHLAPMLRRHGAAVATILDVATGSADIPLEIARWALRRGVRVRITATDLHPATLAAARRNTAECEEIRVEAADALDLPYRDGAFDFVICSTALHHFDARADALQVLREMHRVALRGVVVNDLARSRAALLGARLLAVTAWRHHPITAHDGPLSVRRAYTPAELRDLARDAGLAGARVFSHFPFRVALVLDRART